MLLIDALTGLGGASQEDQQPAFVFGFNTLGANGKSVSAFLFWERRRLACNEREARTAISQVAGRDRFEESFHPS